MAQQFALMKTQQLTDVDEEAPRPIYRLLNIIADDDGHILELTFPPYRSSDATAIAIFNQWRSSEGHTMEEFYQLLETVGDARVQVVPIGII
jgi:hypothetical protein